LNCLDMARDHLWNTRHCCKDCHSPGKMLIKHTLVRDRRTAMLCCHADRFIETYPRYLPEYPLLCDWDDDCPPLELSPGALD
jgi:hypothetical protein